MATHFTVNSADLLRLGNTLGLKHPLHVQGAATRGTTYGRYHGLSRYTVKGKLLGELHHQITLSCDVTPARLIETLIHEAQHAVQEERNHRKDAVNKTYVTAAADMKREITSTRRMTAYDRYFTQPIEVEARAIADMLKSSFPKLLSATKLKEYVVTEKCGSGVWLVKGARSPQAATAKVASRVYCSSQYASNFRCNVRKPAHGELTHVPVINWKAGR